MQKVSIILAVVVAEFVISCSVVEVVYFGGWKFILWPGYKSSTLKFRATFRRILLLISDIGTGARWARASKPGWGSWRGAISRRVYTSQRTGERCKLTYLGPGPIPGRQVLVHFGFFG